MMYVFKGLGKRLSKLNACLSSLCPQGGNTLNYVASRDHVRSLNTSEKPEYTFPPSSNVMTGIKADPTSMWSIQHRKPSVLARLSSEVKDSLNQDLNAVRECSKSMLKQNIRNKEMYDICNYYFQGTYNGLITLSGFSIIIAKAVNCHLRNNPALTDNQIRVLAIAELGIVCGFIKDDLADNTKVRFKVPAVHVLYHPNKVLIASNDMLAITVSEAAKLSAEIAETICQTFETAAKGQFMVELKPRNHNDRLAYYLVASEYKGACINYYSTKAMLQVIGARSLVTDAALNISKSLGMFFQLVDDFYDVELDLRNGWGTLAVILAMKKEPIIEEYFERRFTGKGDIENTLRLIESTNAIQEARSFITSQVVMLAKEYSNVLAPSPYNEAIVAIMNFEEQ